jgi:hypothetical protein
VITCQPEDAELPQSAEIEFSKSAPNFSEGEIGSFNAAKGGYPLLGVGDQDPKQPCY